MNGRSNEQLIHDFTYHAPDESTRHLHEMTRMLFRDVALDLNQTLPECREKSLALTRLEEASSWCQAAIARQPASGG